MNPLPYAPVVAKSCLSHISNFIGSGIRGRIQILILLTFIGITSCFTGVEYTPKIKAPDSKTLSGKDNLSPLAGLDSLYSVPQQWPTGKRFYVIDDKIRLIFTPEIKDSASLFGNLLTFQGLTPKSEIDGTKSLILTFLLPGGGQVNYVTSEKNTLIPFTIPEDVVASAEERLLNHQFFILTREWRDDTGNRIHGKKYVPVTITKVTPGTQSQPIMAHFTDETDQRAAIYLNSSSKSLSTTNPLDKVDNLTAANRASIIQGNVAIGMTTQEARMALGSPSDLQRGLTMEGIGEVWKYDNGKYLRFLDGLLVEIK